MWLKGRCFTEFNGAKMFDWELTVSEAMLKIISGWENLESCLGYGLVQLYQISSVENMSLARYAFSQSRCTGFTVKMFRFGGKVFSFVP